MRADDCRPIAVPCTQLPRPEQFVSEAVTPEPGSFDVSAMARGEPGVPAAFAWHDKKYVVTKLLSSWKTTGRDRGEAYLRRHWFLIEAATGEHMTLYCERQAKNTKRPKARWWLYTVQTNPPEHGPADPT